MTGRTREQTDARRVRSMATLQQFEQDGATILKLQGSLTMAGLEKVAKPFDEATHKPGARIVVDLGDVDLVTTPALSMFIAAANSAKRSGGKIVFMHPQPMVDDVIRRLRLDALLPRVHAVEEGIERLRDN